MGGRFQTRPVALSALSGIVAMTKAKLKAVASVAAKTALRRVRVLIGTPVRVGAAGVAPDGLEIRAPGGRVFTLFMQCGYAAMHNPPADPQGCRRCPRNFLWHGVG